MDTVFTHTAAVAMAEKTCATAITSYAYKGLDKLTRVATPTATVNYSYDALCQQQLSLSTFQQNNLSSF